MRLFLIRKASMQPKATVSPFFRPNFSGIGYQRRGVCQLKAALVVAPMRKVYERTIARHGVPWRRRFQSYGVQALEE